MAGICCQFLGSERWFELEVKSLWVRTETGGGGEGGDESGREGWNLAQSQRKQEDFFTKGGFE